MITIEYIIYLLIILTGLVTGILYAKNQKSLRPVVILLGVTIISEISSRILAHTIKNSNPPYHFLSPLQCILWGFFFYFEFEKIKIKKLSLYFCIAIAIFSIFNSLVLQTLLKYPDNILKIQSFVFIVFGFLLFIEKLDYTSNKNIFKNSGFILSIAIIWFYLISFIFNNFYTYSLQIKLKDTMRLINYVSNYLFYSLIAVSMYLSKNENSQQ